MKGTIVSFCLCHITLRHLKFSLPRYGVVYDGFDKDLGKCNSVQFLSSQPQVPQFHLRVIQCSPLATSQA